MNSAGKSRLEPEDWINAATQTLKAEGVGNVKIDPLAKKLGVTRGSFYWHFTKREALLDAVLVHWQSTTTLNVIEELEQGQRSAKERLEKLMSLAFSVHPDSMAVEHAIRAWSLNDDKVKAVVVRVDTQRIEYLKKLILALGWSIEEAQQHAYLVYYCRVGLYAQALVPDLAERLKTMKGLFANCLPANQRP